MTTLREIRRRARNVIGPFLGLTAVVYFGYHTVQGDRGLFARTGNEHQRIVDLPLHCFRHGGE